MAPLEWRDAAHGWVVRQVFEREEPLANIYRRYADVYLPGVWRRPLTGIDKVRAKRFRVEFTNTRLPDAEFDTEEEARLYVESINALES